MSTEPEMGVRKPPLPPRYREVGLFRDLHTNVTSVLLSPPRRRARARERSMWPFERKRTGAMTTASRCQSTSRHIIRIMCGGAGGARDRNADVGVSVRAPVREPRCHARSRDYGAGEVRER